MLSTCQKRHSSGHLAHVIDVAMCSQVPVTTLAVLPRPTQVVAVLELKLFCILWVFAGMHLHGHCPAQPCLLMRPWSLHHRGYAVHCAFKCATEKSFSAINGVSMLLVMPWMHSHCHALHSHCYVFQPACKRTCTAMCGAPLPGMPSVAAGHANIQVSDSHTHAQHAIKHMRTGSTPAQENIHHKHPAGLDHHEMPHHPMHRILAAPQSHMR